ncbi:hypothetical protein FACS189497_02700 [Betaproteobacteria bacterium]|nr:hypothetical protein FACS189488_05330 [Betaproteobacteria bacterium]GHU28092.1 hypothetical protein FACS189497_02700 [Betaproteobacteria bacterium]
MITGAVRTWAELPPRSRGLLFALVVALHLGGAALVAGLQTPVASLQPPAIMQVRWVSSASPGPAPTPPATPKTEAEPEKPAPVRPHPVVRPPPRAKLPPVLAVSAAVPEYEGTPTVAAEDNNPADPEPAPDPATAPLQGSAAGGGGPTGGDAAFVEPVYDAAYLSNPPPDYPPLSKRLREQGTVTLRIFVTVEGRADQVLIHQSSGHTRLDKSATDVVRRWRFVAARRGRENVAAWILVPIRFNLQS